MTFSKNYLSNQSQPWAREVNKRIVNIENAFRSAEVNNTTRDDQLAASFRRLDANVLATQTATENALDAINAILGLGTAPAEGEDPEYPINGANIVANTITATEISSQYVYAGTISANQINAGILQGITIKTSGVGNRIELTNDEIAIYNTSNLVGEIYGSFFNGQGATFFDVGSGGMVLQSSYQIFAVGNFGVYQGQFSSEGNATFLSNLYNPQGYNNTTTASPNTYISTTGLIMRSTNTSSIEAKTNIRNLEFDSSEFLSVSPVVFNYKRGIISDEDPESPTDVIGFIAEDFESTSIGNYVVALPEVEGEFKSLKYDKLYMFLHKTVQDLEKRVTELENG